MSTIQIDLRFTDPFSYEEGDMARSFIRYSGDIRSWNISEDPDDENAGPGKIGYVTAWHYSPELGTFDPLAVDGESQDLSRFLGLFDDDWDLRGDLVADPYGFPPSLTIIETVCLDPEWRGRGIGRLVAARTALTVSRGDGVIALQPAPLSEPKLAGAAWDHAVERIAANWSTLGFQPVDGTDLMALDMTVALDELLNFVDEVEA